MCFSASASFIAGTSLSAVGVAALRNTKARSEQPLATIPLLFGIQQITEGVIWLTFSHDAPLLKQTMTYVYSGFSHVLWPMYVPFAMGVLEAVRWRKRTLFAFEAAGIAVGLYLLYSIVARPLVAEVVGRHIVYDSPHFHLIPVMVLYLAATCVSCFFSSHGFVRLFGVLSLLSFIAAYIVHVGALVSIWCFFAAILSLLIYLHLRFRSLGGFPVQPPAIASSSMPSEVVVRRGGAGSRSTHDSLRQGMFLSEHPHIGGSRNVHMMRPIPIPPVVPVRSHSNTVGRSRALLRVADPRQTIQSVERYRP